jgi:hypothetical protein
MDRFRHNYLKPMLLICAAMLLRAAIPAGYMPAAAGSGLWFEFCPEGVPAEFMQVLAGDSHQDHDHTDHADDDDHHCPLGHLLLSAAAVDDSLQVIATPAAPVLAAASLYSYSSVSRTNYHSRGPPA